MQDQTDLGAFFRMVSVNNEHVRTTLKVIVKFHESIYVSDITFS